MSSIYKISKEIKSNLNWISNKDKGKIQGANGTIVSNNFKDNKTPT